MPSVPYIGVMDYLSTVYGDEFKFSDEGSGIYTVKSSAGKSMIIDTATDKIHFDEFENFLPNSESDIDESNDAGFIKNMKTTPRVRPLTRSSTISTRQPSSSTTTTRRSLPSRCIRHP